jgi:hypothetical protein
MVKTKKHYLIILLLFNIVSIDVFALDSTNYYIDISINYEEIYNDLDISISKDYIDPNEDFESFYVTDDNLICVSFYNKYTYEYNHEDFSRIVSYKSYGVVYSMYDDNNNLLLIIVRENVRICIDDSGNFLYGDSYRSLKNFEAEGIHFLEGDTINDFEISKGKYTYIFTNTNYFERLIGKKATIIISHNSSIIKIISENGKYFSDLLMPIIVGVIVIIVIIVNKKKIKTYKK